MDPLGFLPVILRSSSFRRASASACRADLAAGPGILNSTGCKAINPSELNVRAAASS